MALVFRSRSLFLLALMGSLGCSQFSGLFSDDEAAKGENAAEQTASGTGVTAGQGEWKVMIILDTSADRSFFVPEQALQRTLDGTGVQIVRAWALGPVEIKGSTGNVVATVDLKALTDQPKGYVLAEAGRPYDFVAPSSLPFLLQQASAYFGTQIRMSNGRAASGGASAGPMGARAKQGKAGDMKVPENIRKQIKAQKGAKMGKMQKGDGAGAEAGATEAGAAE